MSALRTLVEVGVLSQTPGMGVHPAFASVSQGQARPALPMLFVVFSVICDLAVVSVVIGLAARRVSRWVRRRSVRPRHAWASVNVLAARAGESVVDDPTFGGGGASWDEEALLPADPWDPVTVLSGIARTPTRDRHETVWVDQDETEISVQAAPAEDELAPVVHLSVVQQELVNAGEPAEAEESVDRPEPTPIAIDEEGDAAADETEPQRALWTVLTGSTSATSATSAQALPRLNIALVGEGTYPFGPGGVSLWCHQLIEGMPEYSFTAVALTVDGTERSMWTAPQNLVSVLNIPLWGEARGRGPRLRAPRPAFLDAYHAFLRAVLDSPSELAERAQRVSAFESALQAMVEHAPAGDVSRELVSDQAVQQLLQAWEESEAGRSSKTGGRISLRDAFACTSRLDHMLRPLSRPPLEADVCHLAMGGLSVLVGLRSKWASGTPLVLSEHGVYLRERYLALGSDTSSQPVKLLMTRFHRALMSAAYTSADVLAPHSSFNRRWQSYGGGDAHRTETMYNGIDPAAFPVAAEEPEDPTIVFVGRIDRLKDLHTLIRAFAIVRAEMPEAKLRIFGPVTENNQEYHRTCLALVDELGLTGSAVFEGRIADTADAYRAGHVVALTSVSEGFPFTVIEAMSVGRPPVATDVGGVSEAVGDAGFIVAPRDHQAVAQACLTLLRDADLRRRMGQQARQRVLDLFTLRQWTNAYSEIYAALAPSVSPRHAVRATSTSSLVEILQQNRGGDRGESSVGGREAGGVLVRDAERPPASEFSA